MKKKKYLLFVSLVAVGSLFYINKPNQTKVTVNSKSYLAGIDDITDANLKKCIQEDDEYENGIENITKLVCYKQEINNVTGLNQLTNLEHLDLGSNNITTIDVSPFTKLKYLNLEANDLSSIDVSSLSLLEYFFIQANEKITSLDLSHNGELKYLYANNLNTVDLSHNSKMNSLAVPDIPSVKLHPEAQIEELLVTYKYLKNYNINSMSSLVKLKVNGGGNIYLYGDTLTKEQILKLVPSDIKLNRYSLMDFDYNDISGNFSSGAYKPTDTHYQVFLAAMKFTPHLADEIDAGSAKISGVNDSVTEQGYRAWFDFKFVKLTSSKYNINETSNVIDVETDDDATVLKNIKANRDEVSVKIENNKLRVYHGNDLLKEFTLKRVTNPTTGMSSIYVVALILVLSVAMVIGMNKFNTRNSVE